MGTLLGVAYTELVGSMTSEKTKSTFVGTRIYKINWNDRALFEEGLLGKVTRSGLNTVRVIPDIYPGEEAICEDVLIEGIGPRGEDTNGAMVYDIAKVTAIYRHYPSLNISTNITEDMDFNPVINLVHQRFYKFATSERQLDRKLGIVSGMQNLTLTIDRVGWVNFDAIFDTQGRINDFSFVTPSTTYPADFVLFMGAQIIDQRDSLGNEYFTVKLSFLIRTNSWLTAWDPIAAFFDTVVPAPYESVDFSRLLDMAT